MRVVGLRSSSICIGVLVAIGLVGWLLGNPFLANAAFLALMYAIAAVAWNLMAGYTGLISFGHAVFFGIGAYAGLLCLIAGLPGLAGLAASIAAGALLGLGLAPVWLRLRSHWFTLVTIATGEVFKLLFIGLDIAGGSAGLQAPVTPESMSLYYLRFRGPYAYIPIAAAILLGEVLFIGWLLAGKPGYVLRAIRDDEAVAMSLGYNPVWYKLLAMVVSGAFTAAAGWLYAVRFGYVDPFAAFNLITVSTYIAIAGIIGGVSFLAGPILGSLLVIPVSEYLRSTIMAVAPQYAALHVVCLGAVLLIVSLLAPEGVHSLVSRVRVMVEEWGWSRWRR